MPVGSGEDMFGSAEPTVDSYHYGDMNSGRGAAGGPVRPGQKKPGNGKTVLLAVAASLVLLVGVALAVKLILELRGEKDAVQEPAYTETIAEAAPQDTPEQPAPQDTVPEAPIQEAPAQEEPEEDAGAYQPDRILELQPGQLNWVVVTGDYDLYFSVPEGFVETPIGFSVNGNIYCYYAQTLDMLVRVWEAPVDMADDPGSSRLCTAYGFRVDEASMQETENSRRYTCTGSGRRMSVYETWGDLYAYYFMFEYPDSSMLHTSAYEDLASAFLSRASFPISSSALRATRSMPATDGALRIKTSPRILRKRTGTTRPSMHPYLTRTRTATYPRMSSITRPSCSNTRSGNSENHTIKEFGNGV